MIPLSTTTIAVLRVPPADLDAEPYSGNETSDLQTIARGVAAVIDRPSGREQLAGGEQAVWDFELVCDPVPLLRTDSVQDEQTGAVYRVVWLLSYAGDHVEAGLRIVQGET